MTDTLVFEIPGEPVAQGRPRVAVIAGHARVYDPKASRSWKATAQQWAQLAMRDRKPMTGPVAVYLTFVFTRPKGTYRKRAPRGLEPKTTKPDIDNLVKATLDALTGVVWLDDKSVWSVDARKWVGAQEQLPKVMVRVRESKQCSLTRA